MRDRDRDEGRYQAELMSESEQKQDLGQRSERGVFCFSVPSVGTWGAEKLLPVIRERLASCTRIQVINFEVSCGHGFRRMLFLGGAIPVMNQALDRNHGSARRIFPSAPLASLLRAASHDSSR